MALKQHAIESKDQVALDGVEGDGMAFVEDEAWTPQEFVHEPPVLSVMQPK